MRLRQHQFLYKPDTIRALFHQLEVRTVSKLLADELTISIYIIFPEKQVVALPHGKSIGNGIVASRENLLEIDLSARDGLPLFSVITCEQITMLHTGVFTHGTISSRSHHERT
jgi:hypothetical protein